MNDEFKVTDNKDAPKELFRFTPREIKFRAYHKNKKYNVCTIKPKRKNSKGSYKQNGYVKVLVSEHPFSDKRGYVLEHRLILEENLGKFLEKHIVIHHINGIRDDNRLENLEIIQDQSRHAKSHDAGERNKNGRFVAESKEFNEIKFRLFNKDKKINQIYTLQKLISTTFRNSKFEFRGRFTGLKDKTGKEIYEGDILNLGENSLYFIEYKNDKFCMSKKPDDLEVEWASADDYYTSRISLSEYGKNSEIIGNIFENPELLENNK